MTDDEIKAGDMVQLKSGGPLMVVDQIGNRSMMGEKGELAAWCTWFEKTTKRTDTFGLHAIKKVD